jgi:protein TonB
VRVTLRPFVLVSVLIHGITGLVFAGLATSPARIVPTGTTALHAELAASDNVMPPAPVMAVADAPMPATSSTHRLPVPSEPLPAAMARASVEKPAFMPASAMDTQAFSDAPAPSAITVPSTGLEPRADARQTIRQALNALLARHFEYPRIARSRGWQGKVQLAFRVASDGVLHDIHVDRGSGFAVLDESALHSLARVARVDDAVGVLNGQSLNMQFAVVYQLTD